MTTKHYALTAEARDRAGKGVARALRRDKKIPGVIYGDGKEPATISLGEKDITLEYLKGHMFTTLCDLNVGGTKTLALARDVQLHPVTDRVTHVDFLRVSPKTTLVVHIPVHFKNTESCIGIKAGGVLNIVCHDVEMSCLATEIPEEIVVDIAKFEVGDAIKISDAKMPAGATPVVKNKDFTLATIIAPRAMVEAEAAVPVAGAAVPAAGAAAAAPAAGAKAGAAAPAAAKAGAAAPAAPKKK
jgi:large subunit ribosomal protein L25